MVLGFKFKFIIPEPIFFCYNQQPMRERVQGSDYLSALESDISLVGLNKEHQFYGVKGRDVRIEPKVMFEHAQETVIDKESLRLIQVEDLHKAVDHTITATGSATLFQSLIRPPADAEFVWAKQEGVGELRSDDRLRQAIGDYLHSFQVGERALFTFINEGIDPESPYGDFKEATKAGAAILKAVESVPEPQTPYLRHLVDTIKGYEESPVYRLMRGPIYNTFKGLRPKEDVRLLTPRLKFRPSRLTWGTIAPSLPIVALTGAQAAGFFDGESVRELMRQNFALSFVYSSAITGPLVSYLLAWIKPQNDYRSVIRPLRDKTVDDEPFVGAVDAVGRLDELISFNEFPGSVACETVVPKVTNDSKHRFTAHNLRNPVIGKSSRDFVPNSVSLDGPRLTFITGPNSGGKTTLCRSIFQNQILAQVGSSVFASEATINIADRMAYLAPKFDALQDAEGRFGTELQRTRDIFFSLTPKSLVILDELAEGTTIEEKMQVSQDILNGFHTIGNTTILVTHNHELVSLFQEQDKGQFLQVEFKGELPTFRVIPGTSTLSHADKIAKKIGFSGEDIENYLRESGYLQE